MEDDPRWQQLRAAFSTELEERVQHLTELLLQLERGEENDETRRSIFDALFREAHSLKGAARAVELRQVEDMAHRLESTLAEARQSGVQPVGLWFDAAYRAVDTLTPTYRQALGGDILPEGPSAVITTVYDDGAADEQPVALPEQIVSAVRAEPAQQQPAANGHEQGAVPLSAPAERPPGRQGPGPHHVSAADSVRVAVSKLDILLAQAGELAITRGRVAQRLSDLQEVGHDMERWRREWRGSRGVRTSLRRRSTARTGSAHGLAMVADGEVEALLRFVDSAEQRVQALLQRMTVLAAHLQDDVLALGLVTRAIEDDVMAVRLLPLTTIFAPLERLVRDVAHATGKEVHLLLEGGAAEIDRKILDGLRDPLMHMLRNAVDHGIEPPQERVARGKPRSGTITLTAVGRGPVIEIVVEDDGAGLNPSTLRAAAVSKGLLAEGPAAALTDTEARELIFRPGFTTRAAVTATSGRGVGMDVVRENIQRLGGHMAIESTPGEGTRFVLSVPLTLATTRVVLLDQSGQIFALPSATIERSARIQASQLVVVEGSRVVSIEGVPVPIVELAEVLERPSTGPAGSAGGATTMTSWRPYVVLRQGERRVALLADRLIGEQEIVVKSLDWPLYAVRNVSGAAVLGSGETVVILNASDLLRTGLRLIGGAGRRDSMAPSFLGPTAPRRPCLLVVEDSVTTRTLEVSILEAAGYDVVAAPNGMDALQILRSQIVDLIVSDVEMPLLDGFALTTEVRRDEKLRQIPIILVTSLEAHEYRERGAAAGADAYVLKSQFDQGVLLDTVGRLL